MASDLQKGQRESKASFGILAASLFISMVASLVLIVGSAKIETIALTSNHKDRIFSEKYLKYLKKLREAVLAGWVWRPKRKTPPHIALAPTWIERLPRGIQMVYAVLVDPIRLA